MLDLAERVLGPLRSHVDLQQGYIGAAPPGPFDGATCLLTLHFLEREERLATLGELKRRLKPGAPLIVAHHSNPQPDELMRWLTRSAVFASGAEADFAKASASAAAMAERLPVLTVEEDEDLLRDAGFSDVALFYAAFSFRGWVALA
jgi:tRNA (cmo5U34)-methyltransferase